MQQYTTTSPWSPSEFSAVTEQRSEAVLYDADRYQPKARLASLAKTVLVDALGFLLAWRPSIAIRLGKIVTKLWPSFRRA